ncbi:MAG: hypothetical protein EZS28_043696, partial [Streblomastix strix]
PLGAGTVITFRAQTAEFLPIHVSDCAFIDCICELRIRPDENRQIGVGGAVGAFGKNLRVSFEYFRFINCTSSVQFLSASSQSVNSENGDQYTNILHSSQNEYIFQKESQASNSNEITKPVYQVDCAGGVIISTAGNRGIGRFEAKEKLAQYFKNQRKQSFDASVLVDELIQPYFKLDVCVFIKCNSIVNQLGNPIKVLESGGAIVHFDKVGARCEIKSDIFDDCRTTATITSGQPITTTNIADINSPFEPMWEREQRIGMHGTGLVIAHGTAKPIVKAYGTQFIRCDSILKDIYTLTSNTKLINTEKTQSELHQHDINYNQLQQQKSYIQDIIKPHIRPVIIQPSSEDISHLFLRQNSQSKDNLNVVLKKGRFSSKMISLQGTQLAVKGEGESLSSIMQKESSQHLFTLQDSQLDASEMRAELWGASASLIQCNGLERSIISGLRVGGNKLEYGITNGAAFEVTLGELVLIDVKVERMTLIQ